MKILRAAMVAIPCAAALGAAAWLIGTDASAPRRDGRGLLDYAAVSQPMGERASFADIVQVIKPAVIGIRTESAEGSDLQGLASSLDRFGQAQPPKTQSGGQPDSSDPGSRPDRQAQPTPDARKILTTQGSGFFISADGYAVTNSHVVEGNQTAEIQTDDQKTYSAKVVGADSVSDIALLKVDGRDDFAFVTLADQPPRVGDWILAVGNPFGLGGSVTAGIVSARERNIGMSSYDDLIQIDAPVNQGASGGPTFDVHGHVIGVNTMILSPSGGSIGIAFAIPAETVKAIIPQLKEKGSVTRGWLGIQFQPVTPDIAESLGLKEARGVVVVDSEPDGPAGKAGIASTDVITSINDESVKDGRDLAKKISHIAPGASLSLGVLQRGAQKTVSVTIGERPQSQASGRSPPRLAGPAGDVPRGPELKLAPANSIPGSGREGVVITDIDLNGRAAAQGLEPGDIIFEVNGKQVRSPDDVRDALRQARTEGRRTVLIRLNSGEAARFVTIAVDAV